MQQNTIEQTFYQFAFVDIFIFKGILGEINGIGKKCTAEETRGAQRNAEREREN